MSRREYRDSDSKRHRSRFDREFSPKRSRRDGKPATERPDKSLNLESLEPSDQNQKHHCRVPSSESPLAPNSVSKESDNRTNGHHEEGITHSSDPFAVPRSRSFFQHDERNMAGQVSRSFTRRDPTDRGWWRDSKNEQRDGVTSKTVNSNTQQRQDRNEKSNVRGGEGGGNNNNNSWRHNDGIESDPKPPTRKRPSFREKKLPADDSETVDKSAPPKTEPPPMKPSGERREERETHNPRHREERERHNPRHSFGNGTRDPTWRSGPQRRDSWLSGSGTHRGRQGFRQNGVRVEKWKHDLYNEANRSPTPKNEEDQIAKVEALLSS